MISEKRTLFTCCIFFQKAVLLIIIEQFALVYSKKKYLSGVDSVAERKNVFWRVTERMDDNIV